ncbi:MAG: hypothetical protein NT018_06275 [Armatimonadetes bacterium]|nr:hypothetical protein [Armatimonadota bacterium]
MVTQDKKNRLMAFNERITGLGLKIGVPILVLTAGYLLVTLFGDHLRQMPKMKPADKVYLDNSIQTASMMLKYSSIAVVCSLILRFFFEEILGQLMSIGGAVIYFGVPALWERANPGADSGSGLAAKIVSSLCLTGLIFLLPGVWLVLRDSVVRIWRGLSSSRVVEYRLNTATGLTKKRSAEKLICKCWEMAYCREFVRNVCPAFQKKKSCWRIKSGCMCDEGIILRSMTKDAPDNDSYRGIMKSLGLDSPSKSTVPAGVKRARCRRCSIYSEHQRQKYRVICPLVIPLVAAVFYYYYAQMAYWVEIGLTKADRFFSFLVSSTHSIQGTNTDIQIMTAITVVWLAVIAICYCLRALEYLIFDLQV